MMLIAFLLTTLEKNSWLLIPVGIIGMGIVVIIIRRRMNGLYSKPEKEMQSSRMKSNIKSTPAPHVQAKLQQTEIENLSTIAADNGWQLVYNFDTLLGETNTLKRQKVISSILQGKDFDVALIVESEMTSSYNDVERVKYYTQTIGNIPRDISEKVSKKWGRYAIRYSIKRLKIYTDSAGKHSCHVWVDILNKS